MVSSPCCVVIVKNCVGCGEENCFVLIKTQTIKVQPYIHPLFSTEHRNQLSVRLKSLEVILIVNFRSVGVQMNARQARLAELLHRLLLELSKVASHHSLLDLPGDIFYLSKIDTKIVR